MPTRDPRIVRRFITTSSMGQSKEPLGRPMQTTVPLGRHISTAALNAEDCVASTKTPWAPPGSIQRGIFLYLRERTASS